ncbi:MULTISPECIES: carbohydrate kinase family protein [Pseudarthrobacter]|uniref:carbohydrate kinase family protein n=1 Tax=Pseudarthrobacter TaxID=1742993 RepID=UPI00112A4715|nr:MULTISPECIES: PfkB family carbohydrate kinase [Pseudarthrobacter]MDV2981319.1 PfkB family carbohydrate kinase [Actinomycetes bacterium ARC8]NSX37421.1 carbohydrate kinase family protein [Pseudarthrobacter oxydans]TPV51135.1 carbohydrate kinase family protein [Pseudarthrobacter phenanthrenivorans]
MLVLPTVVVCGPASWNHLILLDELPAPVPHMQFARRSWQTIGGTSAGKALHLADLGVGVRLCSPLGSDDDGGRVRRALTTAGVTLEAIASERTERHVNLMTDDGRRISIYVSVPSTPSGHELEAAGALVAAADLAVIDLSELGALLLEREEIRQTPLWVDLHDYDGSSTFHEPFLSAAEVVFMNDDKTDDPWKLMRSCLERGPRLAVCTRGAHGAVALESDGTQHEVAAVPAHVVDTNGAGDAFMAGFLAASLRAASVGDALKAAAMQASLAIESEHLHPVLAH